MLGYDYASVFGRMVLEVITIMVMGTVLMVLDVVMIVEMKTSCKINSSKRLH